MDLTLTDPTGLLGLEQAVVLHQHRDKEAGAQDRRTFRRGLAPFDRPITMKKSTSSGISVSTYVFAHSESPGPILLLSLEACLGRFYSSDWLLVRLKALSEKGMLTPKYLSSVGIPGPPSPRLSTLASLKMEKGDAESPDCSASFIELQQTMAYQM